MTNDIDDLPNDSSPICFSVKIGDIIHEKLNRHLSILKHARAAKIKKQEWLTQAFEELMEEFDSKEQIPKDKRLSFRLNPHFVKKLDKIIKEQRKFRSSYSRKQWFVEAIQRKLDKEYESAKMHLEEIKSR